jgi:CsoR family transcriptional regulator, copper-sensing transcriptional repressor
MKTKISKNTAVRPALSPAKKKLVQRLKIIEGQVRGLQDMLSDGAYCVDVITQTSAVKQALSGVEDALMENHLGNCVVDQMRKGKEGTAIAEILKVYQLKRK